MIEFVTLFLALVSGPQPIEVSVDGSVAAVELRLDGQRRYVLNDPPWRVEHDFGAALRPHELVAIALDDEGAELARVRQVINLPRPRSEARLGLDGGAEGEGAEARLITSSLDHQRPRSVALTFDGRPLAATDPARFALPRFDPEQLHLLRAEVEFSDTDQVSAELVFGGGIEELIVELTAVPVFVESVRLPKPEAMKGWLVDVAGRPLRVAVIERTHLELLVVRETSRANAERLRSLSRARPRVGMPTPIPQLLVRGDRLRFVQTTVVAAGAADQFLELLPVTGNVARPNALFELLTSRAEAAPDPAPPQRLADAVAVAGLLASASERARAVVLLTAGAAEDESRIPAERVRAYLRSIRVPFFVWSTAAKSDLKAGAAARLAPWGEIADVSRSSRFAVAMANLDALFASQAIVWVEGAHLPNAITLSPAAEGLRLVE